MDDYITLAQRAKGILTYTCILSNVTAFKQAAHTYGAPQASLHWAGERTKKRRKTVELLLSKSLLICPSPKNGFLGEPRTITFWERLERLTGQKSHHRNWQLVWPYGNHFPVLVLTAQVGTLLAKFPGTTNKPHCLNNLDCVCHCQSCQFRSPVQSMSTEDVVLVSRRFVEDLVCHFLFVQTAVRHFLLPPPLFPY